MTLWPSKKFTDSELIPGGGAASLSKDEMKAVKARLKDFTKDNVRLGKPKPASAATQKKVERATALLPKLETDAKAQEQFVKIVRSLLSEKAVEKDDGTKEFFKAKDAQVLQNLRKEAVVVSAPWPAVARRRSVDQREFTERRRSGRAVQRSRRQHHVRRAPAAELHHLLSDEGACRHRR